MVVLLRDLDGVLGTVLLAQADKLLLIGGDGATADDDPLAEVVRVEDRRGRREAASVPLALVWIDRDLHGAPPYA